jgi:acyl-CoA thioesterase I
MPKILLCTLVTALLLVSCRAEEPPPPLTYVSLGDSLAVGVGASDPEERGYAPLLRERLAEKTGREVRLVQLGVSGETSETFIGGYPDEESSQLARAEAVLRENSGATVTLSIGGNDLLQTASGDGAGREEAVARYARNLDFILGKLRRASDPRPEVVALALYNPAPGSFTDAWTGRLNAEIRAAAQRNGAAVADGYEAFRGHEDEFSHYASSSWDIHPTDEGYAALARAFAAASKNA